MIPSGTNGSKIKTRRSNQSTVEPTRPQNTSDVVEISRTVATSIESPDPPPDIQDDIAAIPPPASLNIVAPLQDTIDDLIQSIFTTPGLSEHRYIRLTEYSVLRAYVQNAQLLAISPLIFADDDALSPWTTMNPYPALAPYDICPTPLQLSTPHHPYIDVVAPPLLRDNILLSALTDEQEEQLCFDMHFGTFTIWGSQPWNALGMLFSLPPPNDMVDR